MEVAIACSVAHAGARRHIAGFLALVLIAVAASGCGSGSKPAYCSKVTDFKSAVQDLKKVDVGTGGVSAVTSAVEKVNSTGQAAISAVKNEFAPQTAAVKSSLTALEATLRQVANPQQRTAALAALPAEANAVGAAADGLTSATNQKCK